MGKKYRNLYSDIVSWENLCLAYKQTARGKKKTWGYLEFKEYDKANLRTLQSELIEKTYRVGEYRCFTIYEPKARQISALDFKDRLVQHALCNVISPIFERAFLPFNYACRVGYGTHNGVKHVQSMLRKHGFKYYLKTDFSKYFPSIDHAILHEQINNKP